jgi:hypothetical protein
MRPMARGLETLLQSELDSISTINREQFLCFSKTKILDKIAARLDLLWD